MNYSLEEQRDMIYCLGESERKPLLASRIYPERLHPQRVALENLRTRFRPAGHVNQFFVLASVAKNSHISTC